MEDFFFSMMEGFAKERSLAINKGFMMEGRLSKRWRICEGGISKNRGMSQCNKDLQNRGLTVKDFLKKKKKTGGKLCNDFEMAASFLQHRERRQEG